METKFKILVLFYSFTGHTAKLAQYLAEGAREIEGAQVEIKQVPEIVPELVSRKKNFDNVPLATIEDLTSADGVAFGSPVHFGSFASQLKQFIDQLSPVFIKGSMVGKPAAFFTSSGSLHGGEEATLISMMIPMLNLGMLPVGVPYPIQGEGPGFDAGSPYGSIYICGHKGEKDLSDGDKKVARILGQRLAAITKIMKNGSEMYEDCKFLTKNHEAR